MTGVAGSPLLLHNARLADPLDPIVEQIAKYTSKHRKTKEDHLKIAELEVEGGLYWSEESGPYVPGAMVWACLFAAAKLTRKGAAVKRAVQIHSLENPLEYEGPRSMGELVVNPAFRRRVSAKVGTQRVIRTRPMFKSWSVTATGTLDEEMLDLKDLEQVATHAGAYIGLGDWRPLHGRFTADVVPA